MSKIIVIIIGYINDHGKNIGQSLLYLPNTCRPTKFIYTRIKPKYWSHEKYGCVFCMISLDTTWMLQLHIQNCPPLECDSDWKLVDISEVLLMKAKTVAQERAKVSQKTKVLYSCRKRQNSQSFCLERFHKTNQMLSP